MQDTSTFNPISDRDFDKSKLNLACQGISGVMAAGTQTILDYLVLDDALLNGLEYWCGGGAFGDTINLQVVASDARFGAPAGTILNQFAFNWNVCPDQTTPDEIKATYPAKVLAGMIIRFVYVSVGSSPVNAWVNLELHKVLL